MKNQVGTFVLAALLSTSVARADDDGPRTLGRLQFVPSALVAWGFVDNTFAVTTSAGYVRYGVGPSDTIAAKPPNASTLEVTVRLTSSRIRVGRGSGTRKRS